jgi:hypothetical protein
MATKKSTKKKARPVDSASVLSLYSQAVRDDLTVLPDQVDPIRLDQRSPV